ncbi:MAG: diacylglycerol kinase, partial [Dehalococcoidia bacterium]
MESPHKGKTGLRRLINATRYSIAGFAAAARHEDAFRQELMLA